MRDSGIQHEVPTKADILGYLANNNWGRWGDKDEAGTVNLISPEKRVGAARLVQSGRMLSISRDYPTEPGPGNPRPAQVFMKVNGELNGDGGASDYYGIQYHGLMCTHIDALSHLWREGKMWNGKPAVDHVRFSGVTYGGIQSWRDGIVTRGVLFDVPKHRGEPHVTLSDPVHGWELEEIARTEGLTVEPGDAVVVYCGRRSYEKHSGDIVPNADAMPGLHMSCLRFLRNTDCSVLVWDMMDFRPNEYGDPWGVHSAIYAYGLALVDNATLEPLSEACAAERRYEFLLLIAPLPVVGGTGSPVNPVVLF